MKYLTLLRNSIFGIVVSIWGLALLLIPAVASESTIQLWFITFSPSVVGVFFILCGALYVFAKIHFETHLEIISNILLAFTFTLATLSHIFASIYLLAWIAFAGLAVYLLTTAIIMIKLTHDSN